MNTITRKEIAAAAGVSTRTVERKEKDWGLAAFRCLSSKNPILYFRKKVVARLVSIQILPPQE